MIRAILLANATAATLNGLYLASSAFSQGRARSSFRAIRSERLSPRGPGEHEVRDCPF